MIAVGTVNWAWLNVTLVGSHSHLYGMFHLQKKILGTHRKIKIYPEVMPWLMRLMYTKNQEKIEYMGNHQDIQFPKPNQYYSG